MRAEQELDQIIRDTALRRRQRLLLSDPGELAYWDRNMPSITGSLSSKPLSSRDYASSVSSIMDYNLIPPHIRGPQRGMETPSEISIYPGSTTSGSSVPSDFMRFLNVPEGVRPPVWWMEN